MIQERERCVSRDIPLCIQIYRCVYLEWVYFKKKDKCVYLVYGDRIKERERCAYCNK